MNVQAEHDALHVAWLAGQVTDEERLERMAWLLQVAYQQGWRQARR